LRLGPVPEWSTFPMVAEGPRLQLLFSASKNDTEMTLRLRQQDVRQAWTVLLNGKTLGRLVADENDTTIYLPVPPRLLLDGDNRLVIEQSGKVVDDIRVGDISLDSRPMQEALSEATVDITVHDADAKTPVPCRITIVNAKGSLATTSAVSDERLAVRPGVIYTATGKARFGLPAGEYTIHAGRGFAYGVGAIRITLKSGERLAKTVTIRREVATPGYVSSDTHIHSLAYSGHGDATAAERVIAIAGEGIELPIATEHNRHIDYHEAAVKHGVRRYFTPVVGNEVTTAVGHFNIFPVKPDAAIADYKLKDWPSLFANLRKTGAKVVILNHARDLHSGFRPFGPARHLALTGDELDGWRLEANAMEIVNSGAQQSDVMRLVRDWFGMLNRGIYLTPVGASDSHDVSRFLVGQARTYIQCKDKAPDAIDVAEAVESFRRGRVLVSCGLLTEIRVNGKHGPGDIVPAGAAKVTVRVQGPSWVKADRVELYANGVKIREAAIDVARKGAVLWEGEWTLPRFRHDVWLVAVATGPGVRELYWPIAKPYQPTSPVVESRVIGVTGAVWLDADGDGKKSNAYDYAKRVVDASWPNRAKILAALAEFDEAVAAQAAGLLQARGVAPTDAETRAAARKAGPQVETGFEAFAQAWRESQVARAEGR
ncbi:MAG: CehA/McbA family metallohydrolase, partial [Gemmataceae bacterium]